MNRLKSLVGKVSQEPIEIRLDKIVGGGQALGTDQTGRKIFVWGGLPGELVMVKVTKKKSSYMEGVVSEVLEPSSERISPNDKDSYLSTSPWQIMSFEAEQHYKAALIGDAFDLHKVALPSAVTIVSDNREYGYRNKVEFSFWWDNERLELDLAFFKRGSHGKVPVKGTSLAMPAINQAASSLLEVLRARKHEAYNYKTVIIRASQTAKVVSQLYVKNPDIEPLSEEEIASLGVQGFELIYSDPKSPASVVSKKLQSWGEVALSDAVLGIPFSYRAESFFQVNIPVYEKALENIREWTVADRPTIDLYSGVGSLGLSVTSGTLTLVEINKSAVDEAKKTIYSIGREDSVTAVLSPSELALEYITHKATVIVDPPRAGLHSSVIDRLLEIRPPRIIYLSCNPVTQARDVAVLLTSYDISSHVGYNFFPRTPHIEHLVVLDLIKPKAA